MQREPRAAVEAAFEREHLRRVRPRAVDPAQRHRLLVRLGTRCHERDVRQAGDELAQRVRVIDRGPRLAHRGVVVARPACRRTRPRCTRARPDPRRSHRPPSRSGSCRRARTAARRRSTPSTAPPSAGDRTPAASSPSARDRRRTGARAAPRSRAARRPRGASSDIGRGISISVRAASAFSSAACWRSSRSRS